MYIHMLYEQIGNATNNEYVEWKGKKIVRIDLTKHKIKAFFFHSMFSVLSRTALGNTLCWTLYHFIPFQHSFDVIHLTGGAKALYRSNHVLHSAGLFSILQCMPRTLYHDISLPGCFCFGPFFVFAWKFHWSMFRMVAHTIYFMVQCRPNFPWNICIRQKHDVFPSHQLTIIASNLCE